MGSVSKIIFLIEVCIISSGSRFQWTFILFWSLELKVMYNYSYPLSFDVTEICCIALYLSLHSYFIGIAHLVFPKSGNHYTWRKVATTVHNIIVGKLWVDNHGEMDIKNHHNGDNCHLKYSAYSYFSRDMPRKVRELSLQ